MLISSIITLTFLLKQVSTECLQSEDAMLNFFWFQPEDHIVSVFKVFSILLAVAT